MTTTTAVGVAPRALPRTLGPIEAWGFGFSGLLCWLFAVPVVHAALGGAALLVWLPAVVVALILNRQDRDLAARWPDAAGGTPVYAARLLRDHPALGRYAAIAYVQGWAAFPPLAAVTLAGLVNENLAPIGLEVPAFPLQLALTGIAYLIALGGTRALGALHVFFAIPALGLLIAFAVQGLGWLASSPAGPPRPAPGPGLSAWAWATWYWVVTYAAHGCSAVATAFVADSRRPAATRRCLAAAALAMVLVHVGGTSVVACLAAEPVPAGGGLYSILKGAARPFWGPWAPSLVTFLVASGCLLGCATTSALCPRVFYQLARDGGLPGVFGYVSRRGVPVPALILSLANSLAYLAWDFADAMIISNTGWFACFVLMHLGRWLRRGDLGAGRGWASLALFAAEAAILVAGGLSFGPGRFAAGLLMPAGVLAVVSAAGRLPIRPLRPEWWAGRDEARPARAPGDGVALQAVLLLGMICLAALAGWAACGRLAGLDDAEARGNLLAIFLLVVGFVGVAVAAWTALRLYSDVSDAQAEARDYLVSSLDGLVALDARGVVRLANPAARRLLAGASGGPDGRPLADYLAGLSGPPRDWPARGEHQVARPDGTRAVVELSVSPRGDQSQGYVAALHDLTRRNQAEEELRRARDELEALVARRTAELARANAFLADLASTDGLTGLKNRRHFDEALARVLAEARAAGEPASVVLLDVDHFKAYNDAFGHPAGDEVLRRVAEILRDGTRWSDLAARYGGEEFVLILPGVDAEAATAAAERLRESIAAAEFPSRPVTASFGVATAMPGPPGEASRLLEEADRALYRSKERGRDRVTHSRDEPSGSPNPGRRPAPAPGRAGPPRGEGLLPAFAGPLDLRPPHA